MSIIAASHFLPLTYRYILLSRSPPSSFLPSLQFLHGREIIALAHKGIWREKGSSSKNGRNLTRQVYKQLHIHVFEISIFRVNYMYFIDKKKLYKFHSIIFLVITIIV